MVVLIVSCKCLCSPTEDGSGGQYMLCLESSDVSAVSADLQALGFQSGAGINPGRMIRVVHTVVRSFATIVRVRDASDSSKSWGNAGLDVCTLADGSGWHL